ncbi:MAG: VapC toxin family PIN domain ribonuclease [Verrucomicrobia bacterium]|nr:MAG: VapC toxin family PIN domain ribonuclease [Verrucomicrobiota bacterium]
MSWLLDTNTVSELRKPAPDVNCVAWLRAHGEESFIAAITVAEIRWGVERLPESKRRSDLEKWFGFMMEDYSDRFFNFDGPSAYEWGRYAAELEGHYGSDWWKQFDFRDTQIAAIAREYGLIIATHNSKHFPFCQTVDPFDPKNL